MRRTNCLLVLGTFAIFLALPPNIRASDADRPSSCATGRFSTPAPDRTGDPLRCEVSDDNLPYPSGDGSAPQSTSQTMPASFLWLDTRTNEIVLVVVLPPADSVGVPTP